MTIAQQSSALQVGMEAARTAGKILRERVSQTREIRYKGFRDIVTDADHAADAAIHAIIEKAFPSHAILSEEDPAPPRSAEFVWIIDPLDGTTNYSRQYPIFATSIALTRRGHSQVGIVYDPLREECFYAERGGGAFLNGARIKASRVSALRAALIGCELPRAPRVRAQGLRWFARIANECMAARIGGSAALSLCYVGAGRLDAYLHLSLSAWDVAAAVLIAREAGARVTRPDGRAATVAGGAYLAANRKLFPAFLQLVKKFDARS